MHDMLYAISIAVLIYSLVVFLVRDVNEGDMPSLVTSDIIILLYTVNHAALLEVLLVALFTGVHIFCWVVVKAENYKRAEEYLDHLD